MRRVITLADLVARPLDLVKVMWERMLRFIEIRDVVISDPEALVRIDHRGTRVTYQSRATPPTPLRVSLDGRRVRVRKGYVDDRIPTIGGVDLDGRDAEGAQQPLPVYEIPDDAEPGEAGFSYICLAMRYDPAANRPDDAEEDWLTIAHVSDLSAARREAAGAMAYEPLAIVYWQDEEPASRDQLTTLNLKHTFVPGDPGRHFFSGV